MSLDFSSSLRQNSSLENISKYKNNMVTCLSGPSNGHLWAYTPVLKQQLSNEASFLLFLY